MYGYERDIKFSLLARIDKDYKARLEAKKSQLVAEKSKETVEAIRAEVPTGEKLGFSEFLALELNAIEQSEEGFIARKVTESEHGLKVAKFLAAADQWRAFGLLTDQIVEEYQPRANSLGLTLRAPKERVVISSAKK